jgi:hypothetical protein
MISNFPRRLFEVLILMVALQIVGCGKDSAPATSAPAPSSTAQLPAPTAPGTGIIRGKVILAGTAPEMKIIGQGCHPGEPAIYD